MNSSSLLAVAREAAAAAAEVLRHHYRKPLAVRDKADGTPVTAVDEAAEAVIRQAITRSFPNHGIYGEEGGADGLEREFLWLVDPLDGTRSFVRGTPFFSTQIAVMTAGRMVAAVSCAPAWGETAWATDDGPALLDGAPLAVSATGRIEDAAISTGNIGSLARSARWGRLGDVLGRAQRTRGYGDFCHYHLLAAGRLDAVIESDVNILDIAALSLIVERAGGRFTDLEGQPVGLETTSVLAAPPELHARLLEALHG